MLQFRECEKETKTKAFSKQGLKLKVKQTPEDVLLGRVVHRVGEAGGGDFGHQEVSLRTAQADLRL